MICVNLKNNLSIYLGTMQPQLYPLEVKVKCALVRIVRKIFFVAQSKVCLSIVLISCRTGSPLDLLLEWFNVNKLLAVGPSWLMPHFLWCHPILRLCSPSNCASTYFCFSVIFAPSFASYMSLTGSFYHTVYHVTWKIILRNFFRCQLND